jgi:hypothetical protein
MDAETKKQYAYKLELVEDRLYLLNTLLADEFEEKKTRLAALEAFHQATVLLQDLAAYILEEYNATVKDAAYNFNRLKELDVLSYALKEEAEQAFATSRALRTDFAVTGVSDQRNKIEDLTPSLLAVKNRFEEWVVEELEEELEE